MIIKCASVKKTCISNLYGLCAGLGSPAHLDVALRTEKFRNAGPAHWSLWEELGFMVAGPTV